MLPIIRPTLLDGAKALLAVSLLAASVAPYLALGSATWLYFCFLTFVLDLLKV